jgi:hypothetical protein
MCGVVFIIENFACVFLSEIVISLAYVLFSPIFVITGLEIIFNTSYI